MAKYAVKKTVFKQVFDFLQGLLLITCNSHQGKSLLACYR